MHVQIPIFKIHSVFLVSAQKIFSYFLNGGAQLFWSLQRCLKEEKKLFKLENSQKFKAPNGPKILRLAKGSLRPDSICSGALGHCQCDQIGRFLKFKGTKFLAKVAQIFSNNVGILWRMALFTLNWCGYFGQLSEKIGLLFTPTSGHTGHCKYLSRIHTEYISRRNTLYPDLTIWKCFLANKRSFFAEYSATVWMLLKKIFLTFQMQLAIAGRSRFESQCERALSL